MGTTRYGWSRIVVGLITAAAGLTVTGALANNLWHFLGVALFLIGGLLVVVGLEEIGNVLERRERVAEYLAWKEDHK